MLGWVVQTTAVAAALAAVAALAGRWRRVGPEVRHLLWLLVILKLVVPPGLGWSWTVAAPAAEPMPAIEPVRPDPDPIEPPLDQEPMLPEAGPDEAPPAIAAKPPAPAPRPARRWAVEPGRVLTAAWWAGSALVVAWELARIVRFGRRLRRGAVPAPGWVEREVGELAERFGVRPPSVRVAAGLASPLLWCAGRPRLFVPAALAEGIGPDRWRAVIAHELAHLARRDPWVARLELVAEAIWWWNPLFWLARHRLRAEAELACDARVVRLWPDRRLRYAEALVDVCARLARPPRPLPPPALGVGGGGGSRAARSLERRLTMILDEPRPRPALARSALPLTVLAALALPAWSLARQEPAPREPGPAIAPAAPDQPASPDPKPEPPPAQATAPPKRMRPADVAEGPAGLDLSFLKVYEFSSDEERERIEQDFLQKQAVRAMLDELWRVRVRRAAVLKLVREDSKDPALKRLEQEARQIESQIEQVWMRFAVPLQRQVQRDGRERSLSQAVLRARRDGKRAELAKAEAGRNLANAVVARNRRLVEKGRQYVSAEEEARAEAELRVADAEVDIRKAALAEAEVDLRRVTPEGVGEEASPPTLYGPVRDAADVAEARASGSALAYLRDAVDLRRMDLESRTIEGKTAARSAQREREYQKSQAQQNLLSAAERERIEDRVRDAEEREGRAVREVAAAELHLVQAERRAKAEEDRLRRDAGRAKARLVQFESLYRRGALGRAEYDAARDRYDDLMSEIDPDHKPTPAIAAPGEAPPRQ